ncbi:hypothetical protein FYK55_20595 [Roseiconus nitratireducens]|uniref:Uncharacterized protein n=1 Tax=Roseiconus nitratireducens TaxID=2605748 RepID=A0A5M6CZY0_9BACT|nr:hypothetical protein [Roseiconus nitratireducens]KAA5540416.1 hypothetical protein FYK55_20595 [Roseiconus nitratireducens]
MIRTSSLTFSWTPWTIAIAVLAIAVTAVLGWIACRRSGWRTGTMVLESVRLTLVVIAALLLGGPEWVEQYRPEEKPVVAVLWDDSGSMQTRDVLSRTAEASTSTAEDAPPPATPAASGSASSRRQAIEALTRNDAWKSLQERADVVIESFSESDRSAAGSSERVNNISNPAGSSENAAPENGTDLAGPLLDAARKYPNLLGVVLASDGDWNQGTTPVRAAGRLRSLGVPVFAFPVGSDSRLPDIELVSFDVPTFAVADKRVRIPLTLESSLPRDHVATVTMKTSGGEEITKQIRVAAMGRTNESIDWQPNDLGDVTLTLSLPPHPSEIRKDNNELAAPISIREEKLRVLVIESVPRWEYRYLRNALSRDPGVEISCLLFHPGLDKRGGGNADYIKEFPQTKEELARYDVVFLGDVGVGEDQLTLEQCEWLKGLVGQQASGLVFLPGWEGRQFSLLETDLGDLMPVNLDDSQPQGWGSRTPQHFELTELGRRSLLTKLADTADENLEVWSNLPGFQWHAPVLSAKPGTETLSVHQEVSNRFGRLPLLVTRTFGAGKVLFMGTDGAWRWRKGVEDLYHYRFWGQVVRWMAYRRNMAQGESMRLYYSPERPQVRQTITVNANVMEASGEPLSDGNVNLRIVSPSGRVETIQFESTGQAWGAFSGRFTPQEPGDHHLTLFCKETGDSLETGIYVQGVALEQIGKPARPDVMEEIARVTRGQVLSLDRVDDVIGWLAAMPDPPPAVRRISLWSHPLMASLFIGLLALFWIGRKGSGLI